MTVLSGVSQPRVTVAGPVVNPPKQSTLVTQPTQTVFADVATLSGDGTLSTVNTPALPVGVGATGTGTLTASGVASTSAAAGLAGVGGLTASTIPATSTSSGLAGAGTLTVATALASSTGAALAGSGVLSAVATPTVAVSVDLTGLGALTAAGIAVAPVGLSGSGSLNALGVAVIPDAPVDVRPAMGGGRAAPVHRTPTLDWRSRDPGFTDVELDLLAALDLDDWLEVVG